ncbi:hypothetical protein [Vibrio campbellii]|uniref:hypothetical protein n=1 Tax=Vibrio campbellii TaxID=680 RepID=UPI004055D04E
MRKIILLLCIFTLPAFAASGPNYLSGKIKNLTAIQDGILIMMDSGTPDNCEGSSSGWMLIRQENTAMISVVLAVWAANKKSGTVYTSGRNNGVGYCIVNQFDPID